ncbi:ATP-binding protein (plasmid) [Deinococcus radiomollis]|uniref:ATP-binding protein n=1 Tax=Deinococcus radiomollis TaxID=468916 RepID=UPI003892B31A
MSERPESRNDLDLNELQSIVEGSSDCIKVLDLDGHLLSMNTGGMETMEIDDFSACQYVLWPEFWEGEAKNQVQQALEAARGGQTVNFEGPANTFLGTPRWWEVRVSPIRDQDGRISRLLAISRDVTARRTAEQNLLENERGLQARAAALEFQVGQQALALNAFVRFTTAVASSTELEVIAAAAAEILGDVAGGAISGFFLVQGDTAYPLVFSTNTPEAVVTARRRGIPMTTPLTVQAFEQRSVAFAQGDTGRQQSVGHATALSVTPYFFQDQPYAMLATGTERSTWTAQEQAVVESVGRGLGLALERTETARELTLRNAELQARTRALEAFAELTRDFALITDPLLLIGRAQEMVMSMLGEGVAVYYVLEGDRWYGRVQHGRLHSPEVQAMVDAGLPYAETSDLLIPWTTAQPYYQNASERPSRAQQLEPVAGQVEATAVLPLRVDGTLSGLMGFGLFSQRSWSSADRVLLETAVRSLELALDRAAKTRTIEEERTALGAFTQFTEAVGSETDVQALVHQAISLLSDTLQVDAVYFERAGELFTATAWDSQFDATLLPLLQRGVPLQHFGIAEALLHGAAVFADHWNESDTLLPESRIYQRLAGHPYFLGGELESMLVVGSRSSTVWTGRDKGIFRAVGHSLDLALDRALQTRTVMAQRDALDARTQELAVSTQELQASTEELQAFSYSVSHDLRTPVRHMLGFLMLAQKELDGRLDERSARYLKMVEQAGGQMNTLIDALLNLSNAAQQTLRPRMVDLSEIVAQIKATLTPDLSTRNIEWQVTDLPEVWGDPDALKQVLTQLTENAVKFTQTRDPAVIRVWAEEQEEAWKVCVKDNGLGFDPRYGDRLFNLFQRLHTAQQASGTGVGLATVRRLILKHGGQVFAEGQVGQGATFGFTLLKAASA